MYIGSCRTGRTINFLLEFQLLEWFLKVTEWLPKAGILFEEVVVSVGGWGPAPVIVQCAFDDDSTTTTRNTSTRNNTTSTSTTRNNDNTTTYSNGSPWYIRRRNISHKTRRGQASCSIGGGE